MANPRYNPRCPACLGQWLHRSGCPRQDVEAETLRQALLEEDAGFDDEPLRFASSSSSRRRAS